MTWLVMGLRVQEQLLGISTTLDPCRRGKDQAFSEKSVRLGLSHSLPIGATPTA
ncbi:hypothetical protein [Hydrogenophaga sp.]|uniref:hypothetical protein n=1 Tax=Hydrogenophaga sp. TaxID=1904254 RepID=UPI003AF8486D